MVATGSTPYAVAVATYICEIADHGPDYPLQSLSELLAFCQENGIKIEEIEYGLSGRTLAVNLIHRCNVSDGHRAIGEKISDLIAKFPPKAEISIETLQAAIAMITNGLAD